jgi:hypothetical protein
MNRPLRVRLELLERRAGPAVQIDLSGLSGPQLAALDSVLRGLIAGRIGQGQAQLQIPAILAAGTAGGRTPP